MRGAWEKKTFEEVLRVVGRTLGKGEFVEDIQWVGRAEMYKDMRN